MAQLVEVNAPMAQQGILKRFVPKGGASRRQLGRQPALRIAPPRQARGTRCVNCGGQGHDARQCPHPAVDKLQRPCWNCGETGHTARDCKKPKKQPLKMLTNGEAEKPRDVLVIDSEGFFGRPMPRGVSVNDFVKQNAAPGNVIPPAARYKNKFRPLTREDLDESESPITQSTSDDPTHTQQQHKRREQT